MTRHDLMFILAIFISAICFTSMFDISVLLQIVISLAYTIFMFIAEEKNWKIFFMGFVGSIFSFTCGAVPEFNLYIVLLGIAGSVMACIWEKEENEKESD